MQRQLSFSPLLLAASLFAAASLAPFAGAQDPAAALPYGNDPEIIAIIEKLGDGESVLLPPAQHLYEGQPQETSGRKGPFERDYCTQMVYAPERQTALYTGGNHGAGAPTAVWEYHLGSNTWHRLYADEGGDHARFGLFLNGYGANWEKDPNFQVPEKLTARWETFKKWWMEEVILTNGIFTTKGGGPMRVGHTWDTLTYDPVRKRLAFGFAPYFASKLAYIHHAVTGTPIEEVLATTGKNAEGVPFRAQWFFDPVKRHWIPYFSHDNLAAFRGYGASYLYVPELDKLVWYFTGGNYPGAPHVMSAWDPVADTWENLKPNGVSNLRALSYDQKIAPIAEQQTRYSAKYKALFSIKEKNTYKYDIVKNEWSLINDSAPFGGHDARTVCDYDSFSDLLMLATTTPGKDFEYGRLAYYDPASNTWTEAPLKGDGIPKPRYNVGKGYYDPHYNVFVVQSAAGPRMWLYRHKRR
jgi:hypothetical protein